MIKKLILVSAWASLLVCTPSSWAWGRRGHSLIGETAAYLASGEQGAFPLKGHSYDIGYYCNVPDVIWKKPATYETERPEHYMDLDVFAEAFKAHPEVAHPFGLSRQEFEEKFPQVPKLAGRAFWRIRELTEKLNKSAQDLRELKAQSGPERQALQEQWILVAGVIGHYVGDMSMPLHVSSDYDGKKTNQVGIHSYFEDLCVDELFPRVQSNVMERARQKWPAYQKKNGARPLLELLEDIANDSKTNISKLLAIDKASKRENRKVTCAKYEPMIVARLTESSLLLAEIYRRALGWTFDNDKFYYFAGKPDYIMPGVEKLSSK